MPATAAASRAAGSADTLRAARSAASGAAGVPAPALVSPAANSALVAASSSSLVAAAAVSPGRGVRAHGPRAAGRGHAGGRGSAGRGAGPGGDVRLPRRPVSPPDPGFSRPASRPRVGAFRGGGGGGGDAGVDGVAGAGVGIGDGGGDAVIRADDASGGGEGGGGGGDDGGDDGDGGGGGGDGGAGGDGGGGAGDDVPPSDHLLRARALGVQVREAMDVATAWGGKDGTPPISDPHVAARALPEPLPFEELVSGWEVVRLAPPDLLVFTPFIFANLNHALLESYAACVVTTARWVVDSVRDHGKGSRQADTAEMWYQILAILLIRIPRDGKVNAGVARRLQLFRQGGYEELVADLLQDVFSPTPCQKRKAMGAPKDLLQQVKQKALGERDWKRACKIATSNGLVSLEEPGVVRQLADKTPQRRDQWGPDLPDVDLPRASLGNLKKIFKRLDQNAAPGPDGISNKIWRGFTRKFSDPTAQRILPVLTELGEMIVNAELSDRFYYAFTAVCSLALLKDDEIIPGRVPDVRPISIGNTLRRGLYRCLDKTYGFALDSLATVNLSRISGCKETLGMMVNAILEDDRAHGDPTDPLIAIVIDIMNCYNETERRLMLQRILDAPADHPARAVYAAMHCDFYPYSPVIGFGEAGSFSLPFLNPNGCQQGATSGVWGAPLALHAAFLRADETARQHCEAGFLRAGVDDAVLVAPKSVVYDILVQLIADLEADGYRMALPKFKCWSHSGDYSGKPDWLHIGEVRGPDPLSVLDILVQADLNGLDDQDEIDRQIAAVPTVFARGIKIWGSCICNDSMFLQFHMLKKFKRARGDLQRLKHLLSSEPDILQHMIGGHVALQFNSDLRVVPPSVSRFWARGFDRLLDHARLLVHGLPADRVSVPFIRDRLQLPTKLGGFGWTSVESTAPGAYVAGSLLALRQCATFGSPRLQQILGGSESFTPSGSWLTTALSSGLPFADSFRAAHALALEAAGGPQNVQPGPNSLARDIHRIGQHSVDQDPSRRLQASILAACKRRLRQGCEAFADRNPNHPHSLAFLAMDDVSGMLLSSRPTMDDVLDQRLYHIRLPVMLGEAPLEFLPLVGHTISDHLRTIVDATSLSLLSANPAGCLFNYNHPHNMFVKELLRCATFLCGRDQVKAEEFANDYYRDLVSIVDRTDSDFYRNIEPDFLFIGGGVFTNCAPVGHPLRSPVSVAGELKLIYGRDRYGHRGPLSAADRRVRLLPAEQRRHAVQCDAAGGVGSGFVARFERTSHLRICVGRYGEASQSLKDLISVLARVGASRIPGSFGVSDGEDGSGVVAFWLKRRLSRTVHRHLAELHYARAAAVQLPIGVAAGLDVPIAARGPTAAPSGGGSGDGSGSGPEYTADQLLDFESEASAIAAEFLAQF